MFSSVFSEDQFQTENSNLSPELSFYISCLYGQYDSVKELLESGVSPNVELVGTDKIQFANSYVESLEVNFESEEYKEQFLNSFSTKVINLVSMLAYSDILELLIEADVDINAVDSNNWTAQIGRAHV